MVRTKGGGVWLKCKHNGVLRVCLVLYLKITVLEDGFGVGWVLMLSTLICFE